MTSPTIGIVDYGVGNHASVRHTLHGLGYRCRVSGDIETLKSCNLLLLPGVGAFPAAMFELKKRGLDHFIVDWAKSGRPLIGICLGMQLLAQSSEEKSLTLGLGIIPGEISALGLHKWHIGWNTFEKTALVGDDPLFCEAYDQSFYFNHSFVYCGPQEYVGGVARLGGNPFAVAVRKEAVVGVQFHPEKSQANGRNLMKSLIEGLFHAY